MEKSELPNNGDGSAASSAAPLAPLSSPHSTSPLVRVARLARKELREILRDRRTIVTLFAMPLLLYPLMSVAFQQFYVASRVAPESAPFYNLSAATRVEARVFQRRFQQGQDALEALKPPAKTASPKPPRLNWDLEKHEPNNEKERHARLEALKDQLRERRLDLVIVIPKLDPGKEEFSADRDLPCKIIALSNNAVARAALAYIDAVFAAANEQDLRDRLNVPGVRTQVELLRVQREMLEDTEDGGMISMAALVPLILILMTITGAVYPAIDLTAGERERGTLEILVAAPVPRFELLSAKYISVLTVAVLTAVVNLTCMMITLSWSGLGRVLMRDGLSFTLILEVFALLLLFAAFFSAVLLCLTSFARGFKEAQAYLIPLMLASIAPGVLAMMPGLELSGVLMVLPLVNVVLLARDLFSAGTDPLTASVVVLTTLLYALAALSLAARVFGAESVLYSEQSSWSDLVRRPETPQPIASISAMLWCLALMVPIEFGLLALARSAGATSPVAGMALGVVINILLFGALPGLFVHFGRVELRTAVGAAMPRGGALVGAILLGVSLWPLELELLSLSNTEAALQERFGKVFEELARARESVGWGVLITVIAPAILEELFFRGLLFNALKARCGALVTIGATGVLFGLTHVVLGGALGLERLVPSTLLGLILGAVCWRAGSVWPGVVLHVLHNAIVLAVGLQHGSAIESVPWEWLAGGVLGTALGAMCVWFSGNREG